MKIFFDGGCRPNPGAIDIAAVVAGTAHVRLGIATGDNNEAEWRALLFALDLAIEARAQEATLLGDSVLIIEQARGRWPCRSAHLQPFHATFQARSLSVPRLRLRHVPRSRNLAGIALAQRDRVSR